MAVEDVVGHLVGEEEERRRSGAADEQEDEVMTWDAALEGQVWERVGELEEEAWREAEEEDERRRRRLDEAEI